MNTRGSYFVLRMSLAHVDFIERQGRNRDSSHDFKILRDSPGRGFCCLYRLHQVLVQMVVLDS